MKRILKAVKSFISVFVALVVVYSPTSVSATAIKESKTILGESTKSSGLKPGVSIIDIAAGVITQVVGILGVVAVALIVYAGGLWLTAAGNDTKVATAKKIIVRTVIGTIVIGLAYAITAFVFSSLIGNPS